MSRTGLLAVVVCILALLVAGCGGGGGVAEIPDPDPSPGVNDGAPTEWPDNVAAIMETLRPIHAGIAVVEGDKTYFIVSDAGPADGYGVRIAGVETEGDRATVTVEVIEPDPEAVPAEMVPHPYAVEVRDGMFTEVHFQHVDGEYFPRVVGLHEPLSVAERSENIMVGPAEMTGSRVKARGLARVFEATVGYELQNANGEVLERGFTTAAAGGPEWGYFEVIIDNAPAGATTLELFQESAKDGSKTDMVEVPVERCG